MRKAGDVLRSAPVLGAFGYRVDVLEPEQGVSVRGTSDDNLLSGDVLRKLLVKMDKPVDPKEPVRLAPHAPSVAGKVRQRASRRAVKGPVDEGEAAARAQRVAAQVVHWYNDRVAPSLLAYARVGHGRRLHMLDTTRGEVPLETGTDECSGVGKNDDGTRARGYQWATGRTLVDSAGLITPVGLSPSHVHDLPACRLLLETAPVLRAGELGLADRGCVDGATRTFLKHERHGEVMGPLKAHRLSYQEAGQLAELQETWQPQPSRDRQPIAFVKEVEPLWDACQVPLNACVIRYWHRTKKAMAHIVLVTTDTRLNGPWIVRHYEERPEIEPDDAQMNSGGWQLKKCSSTRYREIVFYLATVVLSYRLDHRCSNTQAGAHFADKTRQALAFAQLRSRRTPVIVYAGGSFEIFETRSCVHFILQLPASVQDRLRHWLNEYLHTVTPRE